MPHLHNNTVHSPTLSSIQYHQNRGNQSNRGNRGGKPNRGWGNHNWQGDHFNYGSSSQWSLPNSPQWPFHHYWPSYLLWPNNPYWPNSLWPNSPNQTRYNLETQPPASPTNFSSGILGHVPPQAGSAYISTHNPPVPTTSLTQNYELIPTALAKAFNTMTHSDASDSGWYMDTGATAHLTAQPYTLSFIFSNSSLPLITVENSSLLHATASGQSSISTASRTLYLNNVLLCPKILKKSHLCSSIYSWQFLLCWIWSLWFSYKWSSHSSSSYPMW